VLVYMPLLKFWMRKKNVPSSAEDDVLQEALQSVFAGIGNFERDAAKGKFRGWLRTLVERRVADYFRSLPRGQGISQELLDAVEAPDKKGRLQFDFLWTNEPKKLGNKDLFSLPFLKFASFSDAKQYSRLRARVTATFNR